MVVNYVFYISSKKEIKISVDLNRKGFQNSLETSPEWTYLENNQCPNCPLRETSCKVCPVALDLANVIDQFNEVLSYQEVFVEVVDQRRTYSKKCPAQDGVRSLMGLIMATSECPILRKLFPMANFHLPFASFEESLQRTVGAYLVNQFLQSEAGSDFDKKLEGLKRLYGELQIVNQTLAQRIKEATKQDASLNAVVNLFALSNLVGASIDGGLTELKPWFAN